ncbi:hypothetical protein OSB04_003916 [Centaurea solstitialis]|uniref:Reverse transcriptase domain-containing protein n=1 Tax=Centaurea solstitialis TaxID=347529 RepID=A0AA38WU12_9ASTR|nr:hypothetical protein OSB04_003916 [Centaurea solstitialis]
MLTAGFHVMCNVIGRKHVCNADRIVPPVTEGSGSGTATYTQGIGVDEHSQKSPHHLLKLALYPSVGRVCDIDDNNKGGQPRCSFKIDIQKAYYSVDWQFLCTILDRLGFHPIMRHWIMELVSSTSFSLMVNGTSYGFFKGGRGLRQGCPLSPYLFTLVMEVFSSLFRRHIESDNRFSLHKGCERLSITHLCFADDLMVFSKGDVDSMEILPVGTDPHGFPTLMGRGFPVLKNVLDDFAKLSGLNPNIAKSAVYFSNVDLHTVRDIMNVLPFQIGNLPFRYLGVPLSSKRLVVSDFAPLVAKVRARVLNWKAKFLSFGGRLQLIKSVLESLQLYWMTVFMIPSSVSQSIERLFRDFLWTQSVSSRGKVRVAWEDVCKPKEYGGLGIKRIPMWNRALLTSHIWDILRRKNSLWVSWIYLHRLHNSHFWVVQASNNSSWVWRKLLELREQVRPSFMVSVGDGLRSNAWEDKWITMGAFATWLPYRLFTAEGFSKQSSIYEVITTLDSRWPNSWIARCSALSTLLVPSLHPNERDRILWLNNHHQPRNFSVSEVWHVFFGVHEKVPWYNLCWFKGHVPKHSFCFWLAVLDRLPTQQRMVSWSTSESNLICSLCTETMDSRDHLFFHCPYSAAVWNRIKPLIGSSQSGDWSIILNDLIRRQWHPGDSRKKCLFVGAVYYIWQERNRRLFTGNKREVDHLVKELNLFLDLRDGLISESFYHGESSAWSGS